MVNNIELVKDLCKSMFTDGICINKKYHKYFNPENTEYYVPRGNKREITILFNNKVFKADYRYEGTQDKKRHNESIRFKDSIKKEFQNVFPNMRGKIKISVGENLNEIVIEPLHKTIDYSEKLILEDYNVKEGEISEKIIKSIKRCGTLIKKAKSIFKKKNGSLKCQICGFNFEEVYGKLGEDYIEGHHIIPLASRKEECISRIEDVVLVCANCHRMLHRKKGITIDELKNICKNKK